MLCAGAPPQLSLLLREQEELSSFNQCGRGRVLKRCPLSLQQEFHPSCSLAEGSPLLQSNTILKRERVFWAPLCSYQQRRLFCTEAPLCTCQSHLLASDFRIKKQAILVLNGSSRVYKQLPLGVHSRGSHNCGCLASCSSSIFSTCNQKVSGGSLSARSDFRAQLHSAALALSFEDNQPQEAPFLHTPYSECNSSQPRITDVHGTLNTVLWGIPMIANQISSKPVEGQIAMENGTFPVQSLTELEFVRFSPFSSPSFLEVPAAPALYPPSEVSALEESMEGLNSQTLPSENTQATEKQTEEVIVAQEDPKKESRKLRSRQLKVESRAWQLATEDYRKQVTQMCKNQRAPSLPLMKSLLLSWFEPLTKAITAEQTRARRSYAPYLDLLSADKLAVITMHKTVAKLLTDEGHGGLRVIIPVMSIGEAVEDEVRLQHIMKKKPKDDEQLQKHKALQRQVQKFVKQGNRRVLRKKLRTIDCSEPWSSVVRAQVGSHLLDLLLQTAYIQDPGDNASGGSVEIRPAFRHSIKTVCGKERSKNTCSKCVGVIECDSFISKGLHNMARVVVIPYMPMLVKPLPWQGYRKGGHLVLPSCIMRTHGAKELAETLQRTSRDQLNSVFNALNILGATKWRINNKVLAIVEKIWEEGGRIADIVDRADVPEPQKPQTDDADALKKWRWDLLRVKRINRELHSQRCDMELKLSVAREMKNEECFYYPHNIDFRGRAYPLHPHLNHLGSDMCRGLLEFAEGRPLKRAGLRWLKIQLANLYGNGVDKLSFDDRVAFVEENLDNIMDSAKKPLEGCRWWVAAEDPFQCLATCMEISNALSSPDVESFISHLPVHQDGSCNGLQHYAALGRDILGAESVNLTAQQKPADVYTGIAVRVKGLLEKDFLAESLSEKARQLHSQVDRKLVKQTVMTSVYGVTYVGARAQIMNRLQERPSINDDKQAFNLSCYAAKTTLEALGEMFTAARIIMGWLGDCAKIVASQNQSVKWTTPLGLPVVQPYRKPQRILVRTSLQILALTDSNDTNIMVRRQKSAFPPNFVHSLDSTHMMMTAIACSKAGLTFAGVHDSYWTHAGDVDKMNVILREKFVELYNQPILENLLKSFKESFPDIDFPPVPARGQFDLKEVLQSPYFFN
ncbi:hypothetical protein GOP47_0005366 [Adiantum capillus-veneris]|uniref:DNA-directed RNA polymerase n=1 Tax=Adiantum capillus-veneris TaxID=13818 RepID=A0A9D4V6L5_ADICA|nr:hypothetical protein GOP47_0005366 [Adiantum capillus-veneris]